MTTANGCVAAALPAMQHSATFFLGERGQVCRSNIVSATHDIKFQNLYCCGCERMADLTPFPRGERRVNVWLSKRSALIGKRIARR
jgi:hypothetical protein